MKRPVTKFIAALMVGLTLLAGTDAAFARTAPAETMTCIGPRCGAPPDPLAVPAK